MSVENLLAPLKVGLLEEVLLDNVNAKTVLMNLMRELQNTPIRSSESILIKSIIDSFRTKHNLLGDQQMDKILMKRFSFEYFPSVSTLDLGSTSTDLKLTNTQVDVLPKERSISPKPVSKNVIWKAKGYMMCSIRRHQSTLWTSYRMYLDGTRDISNTGQLSNISENEMPIMLLGAKKLKSGISASCLVWREADSKTWKEKNAVAKITRSNSTYLGMAVSGRTSSSSAGGPEPSSPTNAHSRGADSLGDADDVLSDPEGGEEEGGNPSGSVVTAPLTTTLLTIGAPIALCVSSRSLDKLIQLTALVPKQGTPTLPPPPIPSPGPSNRRSFSFAAGSSAVSLPTPSGDAPDEAVQVVELERALRTVSTSTGRVDSNATALSSKYLIMKSRLPRKTAADSTTSSSSSSGLSLLGGSSGTKKSVHTLAFGKDTRVKSASRKNLVVDSVFSTPLLDEEGNSATGVIGTEWTTDGDRPPILEIGKMEEDIFAVDFYHITPFQAFVIAIAAFDQ